jgi:putative membrane protein
MNRTYFSPFRWIWISVGIIFLAFLVTGFVYVVYRGFVLGQSLFVFPFVGFGLFTGLFSLLLILLVVGLVARMIFRPWRRGWYGPGYRRYDPAMQQLRERYARGEITKEQFDQMSNDLRNNY